MVVYALCRVKIHLYFKINSYIKRGLIFCGKFCKLECESAREGLLCDQGQAEELTGGGSDVLSRM